LFIPVLLGTIRKGRESEKVAKYLVKRAKARADTTPKLFDPRKFKFPTNDYGEAVKGKFPEYRKAILKADGVIIVAPEYNHGYPGPLKSMLDTLLREYIHRPVAFCGVSSGGFGGVRVIENLLPIVRELGMQATFTDLNVSHVQDVFNSKGIPKDKAVFDKRIDRMLDELIWMAKTLRWGRENVPSQYHKK